jgi:3-oxoacyl-[acyl-carrier-protein] synthase-1
MAERPDIYSSLPEDPRFDTPEPLVASAVYHLDPAARSAGRMAEWLGILAGKAFLDMARRARLAPSDLGKLGIFLALPARPGVGPELRDELLYHFHNHAELELIPGVQLHFGGHASVLALVELASRQLQEGRIERAAVGGVDSWLFRPWLEEADKDCRLLSSRNPDGFQPGEGAAFMLLERPGAAERRGIAPLAMVRTQGSSRIAPDGLPVTGVELAHLLEPLLPAEPPLLVCDLNGESARAREWAFAVSRLGQRLPDGFALEHPASVLGDTGAASAALSVVLAAQWLQTGHADRRTAVVWAAGTDGERRALMLERT